MKCYIGAKIIKAEPMTELEFLMNYREGQETPTEDQPGYHVEYPDFYHSWSPKETFESAYREILDAERVLIYSSEGQDNTAKEK